MSINGPNQITFKPNREKPDGGFPGLLRRAAVVAVVTGFAGSIALMLIVGHRNPSRILLVLFGIWVLSPFVALALANVVSKRWSVVTRATLHSVMLIITVASLAIYAIVASTRPAKPAFAFLIVPLVSWVLVATVIPIVALISGRKTPLGRRILKGLAVLVILGVLAAAVLSGLLWKEQKRELTLPRPTGPLAVGRTIYVWADDAHSDALAPVPGTRRELLVWVWYPAAGQSGGTSDYVPVEVRLPAGRVGGSLIFKLLTRDLSKVHARSIDNAEVSPQQSSYPVVIMRGGASAPVVNYSTLAEDLASHGYVVVGFDAPYRTSVVVFPDGRVITRTPENNGELCEERKGEERASCASRLLNAWIADMAFVLDRLEQLNASDTSGKFTGRLDMTRVGVFGHSFGGAQAAQFCHDDSRCKAGIDIDGRPFGSVIREGIRQPFMFLLSAQVHSSDPESRQVKADIQSIYDQLPVAGRLRLAIRGSNHFTFSDDGALLKSYVVRRALRLFGLLGIDGRRQLAVTAHCVHSFFDAYLKGESASRFTISSPLYPEIEVLE